MYDNSDLLIASGWVMTQLGFCLFESFIDILISHANDHPLVPPLPHTSAYHHRAGAPMSTHTQVTSTLSIGILSNMICMGIGN